MLAVINSKHSGGFLLALECDIFRAAVQALRICVNPGALLHLRQTGAKIRCGYHVTAEARLARV